MPQPSSPVPGLGMRWPQRLRLTTYTVPDRARRDLSWLNSWYHHRRLLAKEHLLLFLLSFNIELLLTVSESSMQYFSDSSSTIGSAETIAERPAFYLRLAPITRDLLQRVELDFLYSPHPVAHLPCLGEVSPTMEAWLDDIRHRNAEYDIRGVLVSQRHWWIGRQAGGPHRICGRCASGGTVVGGGKEAMGEKVCSLDGRFSVQRE
jgi:hypothetical protein